MPKLMELILKALPRWAPSVGFLVLLSLMLLSLFTGPFKIAGYEFGFLKERKDLASSVTLDYYTVIGTVETSHQTDTIAVLISPRYPPITPQHDGTIFGLKVWKDPEGQFPSLHFLHNAYFDKYVDLNDRDRVQMVSESTNRKLIITQPIRLIPKTSE